MPLITETYYLSLTQDNRGILRLRCSQDDTLRTVNLKLYNNGSIFVIPSGISAYVSGVKQNGAVFSKSCTISQDRQSVVLQLSSDITNVDGIIVAEIVLNDGEGGRLGTSNFIIQVEKNPIRVGVVQDTETPIEYINDFIEKIQTLTARLNNLITPSGDPSLAEVVDARIGILDSTTYQTLGARLNAEFQRLSNVLNGVTILESTGDTTDRTSEILSKLNTYGTCKLVKGDFYVNSLVMPEGSHLVGSGKSTRIILPSSVTNGYVVKPKSNCIIENVSFYGGFTGTYSELIASSASATRHCIILDRFDSVNSENVILSNISINNFVGSAIIQRYATGCHCKDVVINMCYAGIDISNASYDGQCINISMTNTRYGIVQNGSNFVFTNCISKDSEYHIMSDQQNTECTFSSCTFSDSSLETTSILAYLSNARNGFVFDNCTFDSSLKMGLNACDGIVIKGTNFVGSDTFRIIVSNGRNTLLLITDCIADVEPVVTNAGTAARITSCYLKDGTAWSISEADIDITVDDELSDESENPVQNKIINREISEIKADLGDLADLETTDKSSIVAAINEAAQTGGSGGTVTYDLPKLTIYGDISVSNKDTETKAYQYVWENPAENEQRTGYCSLKWQGESSLTYPKKNYTIKFFADAKYKRKDKQSFFDKLVLVKNKWVLKAHWVDRSMARNIVSCRLWGQMVKSRNGAPEEHLAQAPNFGAINGFPIKVYVNDEFHGLYDFNIPKDEDLFGMEEDNPLHCAVCGDSQSGTGSTAFRQATASGWELEVPDAWASYEVEEDGQTVTKYVADGLVALINFVMTSTDAEFKENLNNYLDVESAIDYYLFCYLACGIDSLGRNLLMVTYDGGNKWYCSLYDADTTWGNGLVGAGTYNATLPCPEGYQMSTSLLWERLEACFGNELYARWTALRTNIFKAEYLKNEFALFWNLVPDEYYEMDIEKWPNIPQWNIDFDVRIPLFIDARLPYCDTEISNMRERVPCTGITLSESAITFSSGSPVTITATATPENTTDDVVWTCSDDTVCTVDNGVVTPLKNGTATITATCGNQSATCSVTVSGLSFNISLSGAHATLTGTGTVNPNSAYTGTLTADTGYEFESVIVTMGGTDITATAYSNGTVSIASVTGDVVVTAVAVLSEDTTGLQYKLASPFTMNGTNYLDTGFLYNSTDNLTIAVDMTQPDDVSTSGIYAFGAMRSGTHKTVWEVSYRGVKGLFDEAMASGLPGTARDRIKSVIRYNATTGVLSIRSSNRDSATGNIVERTKSNSHTTPSNLKPTRDAFVNSLYIGGLHGANGLEGAAQSGTIHDLRILTRRWTDAEVMNWLGVDSLSTIFTDDMDNYVPA